MTLNRDFDLEQETGECSYCGNPLEFFEDQGQSCFLSCPVCDEYDDQAGAHDE